MINKIETNYNGEKLVATYYPDGKHWYNMKPCVVFEGKGKTYNFKSWNVYVNENRFTEDNLINFFKPSVSGWHFEPVAQSVSKNNIDMRILEIKEKLPQTTLPDGSYFGVWGGSVIELDYKGKLYELTTEEVTEPYLIGIGYKVVVNIKDGVATFTEIKN